MEQGHWEGGREHGGETYIQPITKVYRMSSGGIDPGEK